MATQASVFAWETPWTEEPGELRFAGPQSQNTEHTCTIVARFSDGNCLYLVKPRTCSE